MSPAHGNSHLLALVSRVLGDRYTLEDEVARGGSARVFRARDHSGAAVALKILHPDLAASIAAERFLEEISLLACIEHPRICPLLDYGERDQLLFLVTPFVEGPTLREFLDRVGCATVEETVRCACEVLEALDYAHSLGVVHRDVKPENIKLSERGAMLMDFGIARAVTSSASNRKALTLTGHTVGTPAYMSPEQVAGEKNIDQRSDFYSLGCVMFECLAGAPPYQHGDAKLLLGMHLADAVPDVRQYRGGVPAPVVDAVTRALAKAPRERWQSAVEMRQALTPWAGGSDPAGPVRGGTADRA